MAGTSVTRTCRLMVLACCGSMHDGLMARCPQYLEESSKLALILSPHLRLVTQSPVHPPHHLARTPPDPVLRFLMPVSSFCRLPMTFNCSTSWSEPLAPAFGVDPTSCLSYTSGNLLTCSKGRLRKKLGRFGLSLHRRCPIGTACLTG
jgi:hypothetical protein